ncbi:hypothetical protein RhiirC2_790101, partial [Rhizophagus irregularis]
FHSNKSYDFHIPNNIDDFDKFSSKKNSTSKISSLFKAKGYSVQVQKMANTQNDYKIESQYYKYPDLKVVSFPAITAGAI